MVVIDVTNFIAYIIEVTRKYHQTSQCALENHTNFDVFFLVSCSTRIENRNLKKNRQYKKITSICVNLLTILLLLSCIDKW